MGNQLRMRCSRITNRIYPGIGFRIDTAKRGQCRGRRVPKRRAMPCKLQNCGFDRSAVPLPARPCYLNF